MQLNTGDVINNFIEMLLDEFLQLHIKGLINN